MPNSTSRLSALLAIFILTLISFAGAQGQYQWGSPNKNVNYETGTLVPVLISYSTNLPVTVTQSCGGTSINVIQTFFTNEFAYFQLPQFQSGPCTYSAQGLSSLSPLRINVVPLSTVITFISPMTTSPPTQYSAGSIVNFNYVIGPTDSVQRSVNFSCLGSTISPVTFLATSNVSVPVTIPVTFLGSDCSFTFVDLDPTIQVANTAVISVIQPSQAQWGSPNSTINYGSSASVPVIIINPTNVQVTVTQTCGVNTPTSQIFNTNVFAYFLIPGPGYVGTCTYSQRGVTGLLPITINVVPSSTVTTFISPITRKPPTEYGAGSNVIFQYVISPIDGKQRTVNFTCSGLSVAPLTFQAISGINTLVTIPSNFYGNNCAFTFTNTSTIQVANTAVISVPPPTTQTLIFVQVPGTIQMTVSFTVVISTDLAPSLSTIANLGLFCDGGSSPVFEWYSVTLNQSVPLVLPEMTISPGINCYLKALATVPNLLDSQPSPVTVTLPPPPPTQTLVFVQVPDIIQMTVTFNVEISTDGTPPLANTTDLVLFCNGALIPDYQWYNITLNQSVPLVLPEMSIPAGTGCYLEALSTVQNLIDSQPSPVLIKLNIASPFGGDLVEITDQEVAIFLTTVTGNPQSWYGIYDDLIQNLLL